MLTPSPWLIVIIIIISQLLCHSSDQLKSCLGLVSRATASFPIMFTPGPPVAKPLPTGPTLIKVILKLLSKDQRLTKRHLSANKLNKCSTGSLLLPGCPRLAHSYHSVTLLRFSLTRVIANLSPSNISLLVSMPILVTALSRPRSAPTSLDSIKVIDNRASPIKMDFVALKLQARIARPCIRCKAVASSQILQTRRNTSDFVKISKSYLILRFSEKGHPLTPQNLRAPLLFLNSKKLTSSASGRSSKPVKPSLKIVRQT